MSKPCGSTKHKKGNSEAGTGGFGCGFVRCVFRGEEGKWD